MIEWRFLRSWYDEELRERLRQLQGLSRNFEPNGVALGEAEGWRRLYSESVIAHEGPGPPEPGSAFDRLRLALENYEFSDPRIVVGHFDSASPLLDRRMLLEIRVLGLRYLMGTVIAAVRDDSSDGQDSFGFRYDTLEGHIEAGWEWFLIRKDRKSGEIRFSIEARWKQGDFPNLWSRIGFHLLAGRTQKKWHRRAHQRLAILSRYPIEALDRRGGKVSHEGPQILFDFR